MSSSILLALLLFAGWIDRVDPVLTKNEKQVYQSLDPAARAAFEENFWSTKNVSRAEFDQRMAYIDSAFGNWRTGRGRVYLSLGPPQKISRLASTRSFWPVEIWYYTSAENIGYTGALQFLFFQRNQRGDYQLYSPTLDTFTALLNPQGGTRGMFRANDILTEGDIRNNMNLTPAEIELVDAALGVAKGVKGVENDSIISRASSPAEALSKKNGFAVSSRIVSLHPVLTTFQSWSEDGIASVDLSLETTVQRSIGVSVSIENTELSVANSGGRKVRYQHRVALLPGTYTLTIAIDDIPFTYPLQVAQRKPMSEILLGQPDTQSTVTPFQFGTVHIDPSKAATQAMVEVPLGQQVTWKLHQNARTVWTGQSKGPIAIAELHAPPGLYQLEASSGGETRECAVELGLPESQLPVISYNANLAPSERARSIGRQWLARGQLVNARTWLQRAQTLQPSDAIAIDLARLSALAGDLDAPRRTLLAIVARNPNEFEAWTVLGFIEAQLQDYSVAADYYRRALAIRKSPEVLNALNQLRR